MDYDKFVFVLFLSCTLIHLPMSLKHYKFSVFTYADGIVHNRKHVTNYEVVTTNVRNAYMQFFLFSRSLSFDIIQKYHPNSFRGLLAYHYAIQLYIREDYTNLYGEQKYRWERIQEIYI